MKATGEVMSISDNFEGGLMKAIRSLEQHVDSLMSYDFTGLTDEELLEDLAVVDSSTAAFFLSYSKNPVAFPIFLTPPIWSGNFHRRLPSVPALCSYLSLPVLQKERSSSYNRSG